MPDDLRLRKAQIEEKLRVSSCCTIVSKCLVSLNKYVDGVRQGWNDSKTNWIWSKYGWSFACFAKISCLVVVYNKHCSWVIWIIHMSYVALIPKALFTIFRLREKRAAHAHSMKTMSPPTSGSGGESHHKCVDPHTIVYPCVQKTTYN